MLHSVFNDPVSLPAMRLPRSFRTDNTKQLDRFKAFEQDVPGFAEMDHVEREIRDFRIRSMCRLGVTWEISRILSRDGNHCSVKWSRGKEKRSCTAETLSCDPCFKVR